MDPTGSPSDLPVSLLCCERVGVALLFPAKQPMKWDDESDEAAEGLKCVENT